MNKHILILLIPAIILLSLSGCKEKPAEEYDSASLTKPVFSQTTEAMSTETSETELTESEITVAATEASATEATNPPIITEAENASTQTIPAETVEEVPPKEKKYVLLSHTEYDENGNVRADIHYEYDENGRVTRQTEYSSADEIVGDFVCEYDENGNRILEKYLNKNCRYTYEYDKSGKLIKSSSYYDGMPGSYDVYEYNSNGLLSKRKNYDYDGDMLFETTYEYNSLNQEIKATEYQINSDINPDKNTLFTTVTKEYNSDGKLSRQVMELAAIRFTSVFSYDKNGNLERVDYYNSLQSEAIGYTLFEYGELK